MSETPNIVYFPVRGRAEIIRLCLVASGRDWKEVAVSGETMPEWKAKGVLPFGMVPLFQEGDFNLADSQAIARYVCRGSGLYGKDAKVDAVTDMILGGSNDFTNKLIPCLFPKKDEEKLAAFLKDVFPVWMGFFENIVKTHGKNGHASGDSMSLADVAIFSMVESMIHDNGLAKPEDYPALEAVYQTVLADEKIKAYATSADGRFPVRKF